MSIVKSILSLLAVLLLATGAWALEPAGRLQGAVTWQGEVTLTQPVTVAKGAVLTIAAGTVVRPQTADSKLIVHGVLKVLGSAEAPVQFAARSGWQGIEFIEGAPGSTLEYAEFDQAAVALSSIATGFTLRHSTLKGCETAVKLLREARPLIEQNRFIGNRIGIDSEMKSAAAIRDNRFSKHTVTAILLSHNIVGAIEGNSFEHNKQGIGVLQKFADRIRNNRFVGNEIGIHCNQTQHTPEISGNRFEANQTALVNYSFAAPQVEGNRFIDNEVAIRNDQFGSPRVRHNLFRGNRTAIYNYRKSNPQVERNNLDHNDLALFCDYSSYPDVHRNNFSNNAMGVELGIYQSGDWENQFGSAAITQREAASRHSRNPQLAKVAKVARDVIDVSGNWWGADTVKFDLAGAEGNLEMFHDRHDQPRVYYEGFAPEGYIFDLVRFAPWLSAPVADSGPQN